MIGGIFTGDYYKFKPRKVNLSLDKFDNKINTIIKEKNTSETNPYINGNNNKVRLEGHVLESPEPAKQISGGKFKIGNNTKVITNTENEFSGELVSESANKYMFDINGNRLEFYKNVVKDIRQ